MPIRNVDCLESHDRTFTSGVKVRYILSLPLFNAHKYPHTHTLHSRVESPKPLYTSPVFVGMDQFKVREKIKEPTERHRLNINSNLHKGSGISPSC